MTTLDLETHPELTSLVSGLDDGAVVIRAGGKPVAYLERAKPASMFSFRRDMRTPIFAGNSVAEMRREDDR
jgi:hypothetical protein